MTPRDAQMIVEAKIQEIQRQDHLLDLLTGKICAIFAEPYRDREKHPDAFAANDFLCLSPEDSEPQPEMTIEERIRQTAVKMHALAVATGGAKDV
jgi:hypothetical protein